MSSTVEKHSNMKYVHYVIVLAFCFLFRFVPPVGPLTPMGMGIIGTFIGAIYGWTVIDMFFPSMAALLGVATLIGINPLLTAGFGNFTIMGMMLIFMVMGVCTELGVVSWIVDKLLRIKVFVGKPWFMIWFFLFASIIFGMFGAVFLIVIVLQFMVTIFEKIDAKPYTELPLFIIIGIVFCMSMGQVVFPYMGIAIVLVQAYQAMAQTTLNIVQFIGFTFPLAISLSVVYVLLMRFVFRVDITPFKNITAETLGESMAITKDQKKGLYCLLAMFAFMFCGAVPFLGPIYKICSFLTMFGVPLIILMVMMLLKREDGTPLINMRACGAYVSWDMIFLTAYILVMSNYLTSPDTGIAAALNMLLAPLTQFSPWIFIVGVLIFTAVITNVANNLVLTIVVMPFVVTFLSQVSGLPSEGLIYLLFFTCSLAICTPGGSVLSAAAFARSDYVKPPHMLKTTMKIFPFLLAMELLFGLPLALLMF